MTAGTTRIVCCLLALLTWLCFSPAPVRAVTYTAANTIDLGPDAVYGIFGSQQGGSDGSAALWTGTAASKVSFGGNLIYGIGPGQQVGSSANHAYLWSGTAASAVDLNPAAILGSSSTSYAEGTSGAQQVGYGYGSNGLHALLWSGTAASAVDLHPTDLLGSSSGSYAFGISGAQQVGSGYGTGTSGNYHALLWSGTAASAVDLNPTALLGSSSTSSASAISGAQQVGSGSGSNTLYNYHALLWTGTAASAVDLNPTALFGSDFQSYAYGTNGAQQVGYGIGSGTAYSGHALLWTGTAASAVDLHALLPAGNFSSSAATSIDPYGNIGGYAGGDAIVWLAGDLFNVSGTGTWAAGGNWSSGTPTAGSSVMVLANDSVNRTVTYSNSAHVGALQQLIVDATGTGTMNLSQSQDTLTVGQEYIGYVGSGAFTQTGGTHIVTGSLMIASAVTGAKQGSYSLSGSGVLNAASIDLEANGTFSQTGGTLNATLFNQNGGTVNGTLQNQGTFSYAGGTFNGRLLNQGTVNLDTNFTAGNGVENDTSMTVSAGRTVTANGAGFDNLGTLTLQTGGVLAGSGALTNDYSGTFTAHGSVQTSLVNYGRLILDGVLNVSGGTTNSGVVQGAGALQGSFSNAAGGTLNVAAANSLAVTTAWTNSGLVNLQGTGALLGGNTITNSGTIQGVGTVNAVVANSGTIRASGGELDLGAPGNTNTTSGTIQAAAGNSAMFLQGLSTNAGTIALTGGAFDNNNHALSNASTGIINGYGTLRTGGLTNSGKLNVGEGNLDVLGSVVNNGTIGIQGGRYLYFYGNVSGSGSYTGVGTATFLAALSPGNSPAAVSFAGNVDLTSTSVLNIQLGGTTVGSQYDKVNVTGQLALGGMLDVELINGFHPQAGQSFHILNWGSLDGTFADVELPLNGHIVWDTSHLYDSSPLGDTLSVIATYYAGDFNRDGHVDAADIAPAIKALTDLSGYEAQYGADHLSLIDDVDGDGSFNNADLQFLLTTLKNGGGSADPVPEPSTLVLLLSEMLLGSVAWRRNCR